MTFIIKEWGDSAGNWYTEFDTYNNKLGDYTLVGYVDVDFTVSDDILKEIYKIILKYDVISFCGSGMLSDSNYIARPNRYGKITFCISGTLYTLTHDLTINGDKYRNLLLFENDLCRFYVNTDEWQSLPERPFRDVIITPVKQ